MKEFVSFHDALRLTLSSVPLGGTESLPLTHLVGRTLSEDIVSRVDSPSVDTSLMDGFAVISRDLEGANRKNPIRLQIKGYITAGSSGKMELTKGQAIRVTTGAPIPGGADAVLEEEACDLEDEQILYSNRANPGRHILMQGSDVRRGQTVAHKGEHLPPALIGLLASAGVERAPVYKSPQVAVLATGDEVVAPGNPLPEGKLYASNMVEACSWLSLMGIPFRMGVVRDKKEALKSAISRYLPIVDAFITSGGAWGSERDLIIEVLEELRWQGIYHRVKMRPGKGAGFGLLEGKPFFCLPGGPPSNEMALLQLALPGLAAMQGYRCSLFPMITGRLMETVRGTGDWTHFVHASLVKGEDHPVVRPIREESRLQSMARKDALIVIPESSEALIAGDVVDIQLLIPFAPSLA